MTNFVTSLSDHTIILNLVVLKAEKRIRAKKKKKNYSQNVKS